MSNTSRDISVRHCKVDLTYEHHQSALLLMYRKMIFSIAVGIPGTFQGTKPKSGQLREFISKLTVCFPTTPCLGQMLQDSLRLILLDRFWHHVKDVMHYSCTKLKIVMRFHTLFCNCLCNTLAVPPFKLTSKQIS